MPRRKQKKYHFIYKTTNLITRRFYLGMHSTDNLEDGYLGSGKILRYSINKYGKENHKIEILEFLENKEMLRNREKEIVNESLLNDSMCMNLILGGQGGDTRSKKYGIEELKNIINKYKTVKDFIKNDYNIYYYCNTYDFKYLYSHLKQRQKWNEEKLLFFIRKYTSIKELRKKHPHIYNITRKKRYKHLLKNLDKYGTYSFSAQGKIDFMKNLENNRFAKKSPI